MSVLYDKSLQKLELDQVLEMLSQCAVSTSGKHACLNLVPTSDLDDVISMQEETTVAVRLCNQKGNPAFMDVSDVSFSLDSAYLQNE